jgi:hypothetical protein
MDLQDATLVVRTEATAFPELAALAQSAYDDLVAGSDVSHEVLSDIIGKASENGVLRAMHRKYSAAAYDAILMPILTEVDRKRPVPPRPRPPSRVDPLTAPVW